MDFMECKLKTAIRIFQALPSNAVRTEQNARTAHQVGKAIGSFSLKEGGEFMANIFPIRKHLEISLFLVIVYANIFLLISFIVEKRIDYIILLMLQHGVFALLESKKFKEYTKSKI